VPGAAPAGKLLLGVVGPNPDAFDRLTHHAHPLHLTFGLALNGGAIAADRAEDRVPIISIEPGAAPAAVARGAVDRTLLQAATTYNSASWPVWVRPMPEMNGHWSPDCAATASGASRGPAYSTAAFREAFARISIIMRGGPVARMDARLRALGIPPLPAGTADVPHSGKVAIVWNPQGQGSPDVAANTPAAYWPGPAYVDIVANDLYELRGGAYWPGMDALYSAYDKPFLIGEWAPWGFDDPSFILRMFAWAESHPRTLGLVYFEQGWSGGSSIFRLDSKPRSLAAYQAAIRGPRFVSRPGG
jgi:hypothetical protein